jgi:hypothetical protein
VVHRRGSSVHGGVQYRLHGKFHLGSFLCRVFFVREEDHRARCASGDNAFVVDYGS